MILPYPPSPIFPWLTFLLAIPLFFILFSFWVLGLIMAKKAEKASGVRPKKWLWLVVALILGTGLYFTLSDLARIGLNYYLGDQAWTGYYSYDVFIRGLSARMVIVLLGFPLLAGIWYKATGRAENEAQEKSEVLTRKYLLTFEVVVLGLVLMIALGFGLYHVFNWVLGVSELEWATLSPFLGYGGVALIFLGTKLWRLKKLPS